MTQLRICEGCSCHVLASERSCPFCQCALPAPTARTLAKLPPGLSRAQRLAMAAALAGGQALGACAEKTDEVFLPPYGLPLARNHSPASAGGGASGTSAAGRGSAASAGGAGRDAAVSFPPYGVPIAGPPSAPKDAAVPDQYADTDDAAMRDAGQVIHPPYGAPIPR